MEDLTYIKDTEGRILKVVHGDKAATITWTEGVDIEFCNSVLMILFTRRDVGGRNE